MITRYMSVVYALQIWCICKDLYKTNSSLSNRTQYIAKRYKHGSVSPEDRGHLQRA